MARPMRPMPKMPTRRPRNVPLRERIGAFGHPTALAQPPLRAREFAHRIDQQPDRRVRDLLAQHVRRVGDDDAVPAAVADVDVLVADAETGDDLQMRQRGDEVRVDRGHGGHPAHRPRQRGHHQRRVGTFDALQAEIAADPLDRMRMQTGGDEDGGVETSFWHWQRPFWAGLGDRHRRTLRMRGGGGKDAARHPVTNCSPPKPSFASTIS